MTSAGPAETLERGIVRSDHPMLAGHFPGHPIVPGAWLLAWVVAAATRRLAVQSGAGEFPAWVISGINRVKFLRPLAPDQSFECALGTRVTASGADPTMRFKLSSGDLTIAEGSLQLQRCSVVET